MARWILRLYPSSWRRRYGDEMAALLEDRPATFVTCLDLFIGALDARLNYVPPERTVAMAERLKADIVVRFCAFVLFGLGWLLIARFNDPSATFVPAAAAHPGLAILLDLFRLAGILAAIGIAVGGLPLVALAVQRAKRRREGGTLRLFAWAGGSALGFLLATLAVAVGHPPLPYVLAYLALSLILLILGSAAVSMLVLRADLKERELRHAHLPAVLVAYGMLSSLLAAIALGALVAVTGPGLFTSQDVGPLMFSLGVLLLGFGTLVALLGGHRVSLTPAGGGPA